MKVKQFSKRLSTMILAIAALFIMLPTIAAQASTPDNHLHLTKKITLTLYNKKDVNDGFSKTKRNIQRIGYTDGKKVTNLKSSNKSVLTVSKEEVKTNGTTWTYVYANVKKTGTSKVSFRLNGKKYTITVYVKKYQNPISSVKIGSTVIRGSKFKSTSNYSLKYSKFKGKKVKVTVKLAKGWDFFYKDYESNKRGIIFAYPTKTSGSELKNGKSITVKGKKGYTFHVTVYQKSTGRVEDISVILK